MKPLNIPIYIWMDLHTHTKKYILDDLISYLRKYFFPSIIQYVYSPTDKQFIKLFNCGKIPNLHSLQLIKVEFQNKSKESFADF